VASLFGAERAESRRSAKDDGPKGSGKGSGSGVVIAPEIDFAVLVACNRGWKGIAAWKTRQALKALIRTFASPQPKHSAVFGDKIRRGS
jgi:hypothetical protein